MRSAGISRLGYHLDHAFKGHLAKKYRSIDHSSSPNLIKERANRTKYVNFWPYDLAAGSELPLFNAHQWETAACLLGRHSEFVFWWPRPLRQRYPGLLDGLFEAVVAQNRASSLPLPARLSGSQSEKVQGSQFGRGRHFVCTRVLPGTCWRGIHPAYAYLLPYGAISYPAELQPPPEPDYSSLRPLSQSVANTSKRAQIQKFSWAYHATDPTVSQSLQLGT